VSGRFDLSDRVAAVVGTSWNIGTGIALGLAGAGAAVACLDRDAVMAESAAREISGQGGRAIGVQCDSTTEGDVGAALSAVANQLGTVDILVNGAAHYNQKGILDTSVAEWRSQIGVILDSAFIVTQDVAHRLVEAGRPGSIITLISTAGFQGEVGNVAYCTAKSALLNFTRAVAMDLAPYGIRANSLSPTATNPREGLERAARWGLTVSGEGAIASVDQAATILPLGRAPSPRHYGDAAVFLASDAAEMITGEELRVDAGAIAKYWRDGLR